jgi:hypothetical protein
MGQLAVICVGAGGKIKGSGVDVLSLNHHCADVSKVILAYAAQAQ